MPCVGRTVYAATQQLDLGRPTLAHEMLSLLLDDLRAAWLTGEDDRRQLIELRGQVRALKHDREVLLRQLEEARA